MADKSVLPEAARVASEPDAAPNRPRLPLVILLVQLGLIAVAVLATLAQLTAWVRTPAWLVAAAAVAVAFRRGRDAIDWIARGVGLGVVAVVLLGPALDALGLRLWSDTWALALGALAALAVLVGYLRSAATDPVRRPLGAADTDVDFGASQGASQGTGQDTDRGAIGDAGTDDASGGRRSLMWGTAAAIVVVAALAGAGLSGRTGTPDVEMWLVNPADATSKAATLKVAVRTDETLADARLSVTSLAPAVAVPSAPAAGPSTPAAAPEPAQTFAVAAGETVERSVTVPSGRVEIRLSSASRPGLDRTLVLNR